MAKEKFDSSKGIITFSASVVAQFRHSNKHQRWGQAFHDFMKLGRSSCDTNFCDRLYNEPNEDKAKAMVRSRTDCAQ